MTDTLLQKHGLATERSKVASPDEDSLVSLFF